MTMAGALIGSFAIPLDWDQPWQVSKTIVATDQKVHNSLI